MHRMERGTARGRTSSAPEESAATRSQGRRFSYLAMASPCRIWVTFATAAALVLGIGVGPAAGKQSTLRVARGIHAWFLASDGDHELAYGVAPYPTVAVENAHTGARRLFPRRACPREIFLRPVIVASRRFLQHCEGDWRFTDLRTGLASEVPIPASLGGPLVLRLGDQWMEEMTLSSPFEEPRLTLFNPRTSAVVPLPETGASAYVDLNAASPVQPLCAPIVLPLRTRYLVKAHRPAGTREESWRVIGVSRGWVLATDFTGALMAWRCGTPAPERIASHPGSVQVGAGIVTWLESEKAAPYAAVLFAERLSTGRRWHWRSRYAFRTGPDLFQEGGVPISTAVHTSRAVYAAEECPAACAARHEVAPIVKASLTGL